MKATGCILFIALLATIAFARQSEVALTVASTDTTRVMSTYGPDSILRSTSLQKMINRCWKELEYRQYDINGKLKEAKIVRYAEGKNNTCDFTPYIAHYRVYEKQKLHKEYFQHAACDECEVSSCGVERRWDASGSITYEHSYGKCSFKPARAK